jgi:hypothetical protein
MGRSGGNKNQLLAEKSASGEAVRLFPKAGA